MYVGAPDVMSCDEGTTTFEEPPETRFRTETSHRRFRAVDVGREGDGREGDVRRACGTLHEGQGGSGDVFTGGEGSSRSSWDTPSNL